MSDKLVNLKSHLLKSCPTIGKKQILTDEASLSVCSIDASFYSLTPKAIVDVDSQEQVLELLNEAHKLETSVTFRAAGTSLSGQAQGDGIVLRINKAWKKIDVLNSGQQIKLQPGVVGSHANESLAPYLRKIGPDPASIKSCMIGGIVANNASGMCCGIHQNSYETLKSMKFILPPRFDIKASLIDTSFANARERFLIEHKDLSEEILKIRKQIFSSVELQTVIKSKYVIKNTMGYSLNSFIDYEHPLDILSHLLVGSEGTLGFISEVVMNTVHNEPYRCCALAFFPSIRNACEAVSTLDRDRVNAAELMDRSSLKSIEDKPGVPSYIRDFPNGVSALLIEVRASSPEQLIIEEQKLKEILSNFELIREAEVSSKPSDYDRWWDIRKGLLPSNGHSRAVGTTLIIEDVAFKKNDFPQATEDLIFLLKKYYKDAVLFGHALDSNLHFVFAQDFNNKESVKHYELFMDELGELVGSKWKGSLKAEHGTGRNMAPFVIKEWGDEAYQIMKDIKSVIDPQNILNPGVIINSNDKVHIENLKKTPSVDPMIDHCIDCGFCEPTCPSKDLTLTPRLRISAFRRLASAKNNGLRKNIEKFISYSADDSCATDGMCAIACPVGIDTGLFIKKYRARNIGYLKNQIGSFFEKNFSLILNFSKVPLYLVSISPRFVVNLLGRIPRFSYMPWLPNANSKKVTSNQYGFDRKVIYLASCITRTMGPSKQDVIQKSLPETLISILNKSKFDVLIPNKLGSLCCGLPFESKGLFEQADNLSNEVERELIQLSNHGEIPIIIDNSPCSFRLKKSLNKKLKVYDSIEFISNFVDPAINKSDENISIHITCSSQKMGIEDSFMKLAQKCSTNVTYPSQIKCCGFAGDKGFSLPELNDSALQGLKETVSECSRGFCSSRTCEVGISKSSGIPYQSLLYLIDDQMVEKKS